MKAQRPGNLLNAGAPELCRFPAEVNRSHVCSGWRWSACLSPWVLSSATSARQLNILVQPIIPTDRLGIKLLSTQKRIVWLAPCLITVQCITRHFLNNPSEQTAQSYPVSLNIDCRRFVCGMDGGKAQSAVTSSFSGTPSKKSSTAGLIRLYLRECLTSNINPISPIYTSSWLIFTVLCV